MNSAMDEDAMDGPDLFVELPLQVKADGIYYYRLNQTSGPTAASNVSASTGTIETCIWRRNQRFVIWTEDSSWKKLAYGLLNKGPKVDEKILVELIQANGGYENGARHLAAMANTPRLKLKNPESSPEMLYQQLIFPPLSGLFYSYDPDLYAADTTVYTGIFTYKNQFGHRAPLAGVKPDAALKFSKQHLVLAILELKKRGLDQIDMQTCVLMSSISALALVRSAGLDSATIPFVVNNCEAAILFINTVRKGSECPRIQKIFEADMSEQGEVAVMVAYLAVILNTLKQDIAASPSARRLRSNLNNLLMPNTTSSSIQQTSPNRSQSMGDASDQSSKKPRGDSREGQHAAAKAAACDGEVIDLRGCAYLSRRGHVGSPLYFVGALASTELPVFIKVWRVEGERPRQRDVEREIRMLKMANQSGVPCPQVVDELTKVSFCSEQGQYHRLVMHKLPNHSVRDEDLLHFAVSLIGAVLKLHEAGILHCDLKPNNILWNSISKVAFLADFGHAQQDAGAKSYVGTVGFTAPEILREAAPHSRLTDAYSVGRTLQHVSENVVRDSNEHHQLVRDAAAELSREDPPTRSTLECALQHILHPTAGMRDHSLASQRPSINIISP
jgi:Protein kinase domain